MQVLADSRRLLQASAACIHHVTSAKNVLEQNRKDKSKLWLEVAEDFVVWVRKLGLSLEHQALGGNRLLLDYRA